MSTAPEIDVDKGGGDVSAAESDVPSRGERCGCSRGTMWTRAAGDVEAAGGALADGEGDVAAAGSGVAGGGERCLACNARFKQDSDEFARFNKTTPP